MNNQKLNTIQLIVISLSIGFLSHHLLVLIPQQETLIQTLSQFKTQFSMLYKAQQLTILKVIGVTWIVDSLICIMLVKKKTTKFNYYFCLANLGLLILGLIILGIDFTLQLMLLNGYHVFAYNSSNLIHWGLLSMWLLRFIITLIQIKTCKSKN